MSAPHWEVTLYDSNDTLTIENNDSVEAIQGAKRWAKKQAAGRKNLRARVEYAGKLVDEFCVDDL